eukprot:jgi/Mesvir1/15209/Mv06441-RA.1
MQPRPHSPTGAATCASIIVFITALRRVPGPTLRAVKAWASGERTWGGRPWNLPPPQVDALLRNLPGSLRDALLPFQLEGVRYGLSRGGRCLIGDEMGIGKTIQSIAIACCYLPEWPLLVVCPSSMRIPWADELERWLPLLRPTDIHLVEASVDQIPPGAPLPKVVVISYRMLAILGERITRRAWGVVIIDECHHMRCSAKKPTDEVRYMVDVVQRTKRAILLSGTPSLTRPFDLFFEVDSLRPGLLGSNKFAFAKAYCNWRPTAEYKSKAVSGGTHLNELHVLLREAVMIRRLKSEVMSQLPPKRRQAVQLVLVPRTAAATRGAPHGSGLDQDMEGSGFATNGESEGDWLRVGTDEGEAGGMAWGREDEDFPDHAMFGGGDAELGRLGNSKDRACGGGNSHHAHTSEHRGTGRGPVGELMRLSEAKRPAVLEWLREMLCDGRQGGNGQGPSTAGGASSTAGDGSSTTDGALIPKTLIFGHYMEMLDAVQALLEELRVPFVRIDGRVPPGVRHERVRAFNMPTPPGSPRRHGSTSTAGSARGVDTLDDCEPSDNSMFLDDGVSMNDVKSSDGQHGTELGGHTSRQRTAAAGQLQGPRALSRTHAPMPPSCVPSCPPSVRVALVSITAGGVGLDLHAAARVVFTELYPDVSQMMQAEDRAHRHGARGGQTTHNGADTHATHDRHHDACDSGEGHDAGDGRSRRDGCAGGHCQRGINVYYLVGARTYDEVLWGKLRAQWSLASGAVDGESKAEARGLAVENAGDAPWEAGTRRTAAYRSCEVWKGADVAGASEASVGLSVGPSMGHNVGQNVGQNMGQDPGQNVGVEKGMAGATPHDQGAMVRPVAEGSMRDGRVWGDDGAAGTGVDVSAGGGAGSAAPYASSSDGAGVGDGAVDAVDGITRVDDVDSMELMFEVSKHSGRVHLYRAFYPPPPGQLPEPAAAVPGAAPDTQLDSPELPVLVRPRIKASGHPERECRDIAAPLGARPLVAWPPENGGSNGCQVVRGIHKPQAVTNAKDGPGEQSPQQAQSCPSTGRYPSDAEDMDDLSLPPLVLVQPLQVNLQPEELLACSYAGGEAGSRAHLAHLPAILRKSERARACVAAFMAEWARLRPIERRMLQEAGRPLPPMGLLAEVAAETRRFKALATGPKVRSGQGTASAAYGVVKGPLGGHGVTNASANASTSISSVFAPMPGAADASFRRFTPAVEVLPPLPAGGYVVEVRWWLGGKSTRGHELRPPTVTLSPFSADGRPLCKLCHAPRPYGGVEPRTAVDFFCGAGCHRRYSCLSARGAGYQRRQLFGVERGVCVVCGLDAHALAERVRRAPPGRDARVALILAAAPAFASWPASLARLAASGSEGDAWHADHVTPVFLGGGECGLGNLRTLCVPCHLEVTAAQARRRAEASRKAKKGDQGSVEEGQGAGKGNAGQECMEGAKAAAALKSKEDDLKRRSQTKQTAAGSKRTKSVGGALGGEMTDAVGGTRETARRWRFARLPSSCDDGVADGQQNPSSMSLPHPGQPGTLGNHEPGRVALGLCTGQEGGSPQGRKGMVLPWRHIGSNDGNGERAVEKHARVVPDDPVTFPSSPSAASKGASVSRPTSSSVDEEDSSLSDDEYLLSAGLIPAPCRQ